MMLICQLPIGLIVSMLNMESRSAMAPPDRMEHVLTPLVLKPTCEPEISTAVLRALVIFVILMADHLILLYTAASIVWSPDP